jgi:hypothetical protein
VQGAQRAADGIEPLYIEPLYKRDSTGAEGRAGADADLRGCQAERRVCLEHCAHKILLPRAARQRRERPARGRRVAGCCRPLRASGRTARAENATIVRRVSRVSRRQGTSFRGASQGARTGVGAQGARLGIVGHAEPVGPLQRAVLTAAHALKEHAPRQRCAPRAAGGRGQRGEEGGRGRGARGEGRAETGRERGGPGQHYIQDHPDGPRVHLRTMALSAHRSAPGQRGEGEGGGVLRRGRARRSGGATAGQRRAASRCRAGPGRSIARAPRSRAPCTAASRTPSPSPRARRAWRAPRGQSRRSARRAPSARRDRRRGRGRGRGTVRAAVPSGLRGVGGAGSTLRRAPGSGER